LGALSQVRDGAGRTFTFAYDSVGRVDSLQVFPAGTQSPGIIETRAYDADSRLISRVRKRGNGSGDLVNVSLLYDRRGKVLQAVSHDAATHHTNEQTRLAYDGVGAAVASEVRDLTGPQLWEAEEFRNNAFGSVWYSRRTTLSDGAEQPRHSGLDSHQGLRATGLGADTVPTGTCLSAQVYQDTVFQGIDLAGNLSRQGEYKVECHSRAVLRDMAAMSYFSGDNRLVALQRYDSRGIWEEYRYDAQGRRVLQRARRDSICGPPDPDLCTAFVQRTAWDGDQVLLEERHDGNDGGGGAPHYGTVGYVHGGGIDEPLEILDIRFSTPRIPHANWRGLPESSSWPDGTPADCSIMVSPCTTIAWPAGQGVYFRPVIWPSPPPVDTWVGSLASNGQDGTGQLYRRNRYYDPLTGRFTQEDPIGLAGGLNLYGFGGGDPVNFRDPFGLCPEENKGNCTQSDVGSTAIAAAQECNLSCREEKDWAKGTSVPLAADPIFNALTFGAGSAEGAVVGEGADVAADVAANNAANGVRLAKSLASRAQMAERGHVMAGGESGTIFRNAGKFVEEYGGKIADWVKKTSTSFTGADGVTFQTHWVENLATGFRTAFKTVISE